MRPKSPSRNGSAGPLRAKAADLAASSICINSGVSHAFETDSFKGRAILWVAGLPSTPPGMFAGQKRKSHLIVQGQFKRRVGLNEIWVGQRFQRRLLRLPPAWLLEWVFMLARRLSPSMQIGNPEAPFILSPLVSTAEVINVADKGKERPMTAEPVEDMRGLGNVPSTSGWGEVASSKARKQYFSSAGNRRGGQFNTEHVYTFHFWQHLLDLAAWQLSTGFATFDLRRHLAGQPLRAMAELPSGERLWDFELAHDGGAC